MQSLYLVILQHNTVEDEIILYLACTSVKNKMSNYYYVKNRFDKLNLYINHKLKTMPRRVVSLIDIYLPDPVQNNT